MEDDRQGQEIMNTPKGKMKIIQDDRDYSEDHSIYHERGEEHGDDYVDDGKIDYAAPDRSFLGLL